MKIYKLMSLCVAMLSTIYPIHIAAQIVLIGDNCPYEAVNDGDFRAVERPSWRHGKIPPFWSMEVVKHNGIADDATVGYCEGWYMYSTNYEAVAESKLLNTNPDYQNPKVGDVLLWEFGADLEYVCNGTVTVSLLFAEHERLLAERVKLIGADRESEVFSGTYTLTQEDVAAGHPSIRVRMYTDDMIKVMLDYINISVYDPKRSGPQLLVEVCEDSNNLVWSDDLAQQDDIFSVYRQDDDGAKFTKLAELPGTSYSDQDLISGRYYTYVVTRIRGDVESAASNRVKVVNKDDVAPQSPTNIAVESFDSEVVLSWSPSIDNDVKSYSVYRGDVGAKSMKLIGEDILQPTFDDVQPAKNQINSYIVYAHDFSGNRSVASQVVTARVNTVYGSSFIDLVRPMPIGDGLRRDIWGADGVVPRDPNNGIESPDWSYWGGRPLKDRGDGKYHMVVTRWPSDAPKGHWEWPFSTLAHAVSEDPIGPYIVKDELAYDYQNGLGHNPDVIELNDGTYALYSLVAWRPKIFRSKSMNGPWELMGEIEVEGCDIMSDFHLFRNLTGVQCEDGRIIIVTKFGATIVSDSGLLGPYRVVSCKTRENMTIPPRYRNLAYEDPVMWRDDIQYHMIINAFLNKTAIYLRSKDGMNWVYDPGLAYTPDCIFYENGVQSKWDKLERPHLILDEYKRATHLSVAVVDVPKEIDYGGDNHSSKNLIVPLLVHKRLEMLNRKRVDANTTRIKIKIISEDGFDATSDLDLNSLRFGAPSEVNYGRGAKVINSKRSGDDLIVEFDGAASGVNDEDFACKLLGRDLSGELVIGYTKMSAE